MCVICEQKAAKIAKLAQFLRENAPTIRSCHYSRMMNAAADDLDAMVRYYSEACRCAETSGGPAADQAVASSSTALPPPLATPTIAGRSSRSCNT
jgi:hypothetical protein